MKWGTTLEEARQPRFMILKRRSMSDVLVGRQSFSNPVQLKMRLPRNHVEKIGESRDEAEVARKIFHLCLQNSDDYYLV
nr:predicted protein [Ipomoea batatas]